LAAAVQTALKSFPPPGCTIDMGGARERLQQETATSCPYGSHQTLGLIFLIQSRSSTRSANRSSSCPGVVSIAGVFWGLTQTQGSGIVMTGVGIIALAGVVVKNRHPAGRVHGYAALAGMPCGHCGRTALLNQSSRPRRYAEPYHAIEHRLLRAVRGGCTFHWRRSRSFWTLAWTIIFWAGCSPRNHPDEWCQ
jgi:hypothetical protein